MTLYLIAHKVRGEPAFDIAERMECPLCNNHDDVKDGFCHACDEQRFWWIIPTSGHRAYPYWNFPLDALAHDTEESIETPLMARTLDEVPPMPSDWPDHYASPGLTLREPDAQRAEGRGLLAKLGLTRKTPFTDRRL